MLRQIGPERPSSTGPATTAWKSSTAALGRARNAASGSVAGRVDYLGSGSSGMYDHAGRTVRWNLAALPVGQRHAVALRLLPRVAGTQVNQLQVRTGDGQEVQLATPLQVRAERPPRCKSASSAPMRS